MSQYLHIFIRNKDDYIELNCYGRGSTLYDAFSHYAPYEKVAPVDAYITDILNMVRQDKENCEKTLRDYDERIEAVKTMSGDLDERIDMINEYMDSKSEVKDSLEATIYAENIITFLYGVIDEYQMNVKYEGAPNHPRIYVGIECGSNITPDMVAE